MKDKAQQLQNKAFDEVVTDLENGLFEKREKLENLKLKVDKVKIYDLLQQEVYNKESRSEEKIIKLNKKIDKLEKEIEQSKFELQVLNTDLKKKLYKESVDVLESILHPKDSI